MSDSPAAAAGASAYRHGEERIVRIVVTTGNDVAGYRITGYLGIVRGVIVRSTGIGQGIVGAFKSIGGGNIQEYADVCEAARHDAYLQMVAHAEHLHAHGIIGMRYDATEFAQGATEVLAYGTAVTLERA
jgi:uncharacterized protein YbjQ (UPF0145 family)